MKPILSAVIVIIDSWLSKKLGTSESTAKNYQLKIIFVVVNITQCHVVWPNQKKCSIPTDYKLSISWSVLVEISDTKHLFWSVWCHKRYSGV